MPETVTQEQNKIFDFTYDSSFEPFTVPVQAYLAANETHDFTHIGTGVIVFAADVDTTARKVLLVQRSLSDSSPGLWETPGGGADDEDPSILHSAARELWEEAGLKAKHFVAHVGGIYRFRSRAGKEIGKFNFVVEVEEDQDVRQEPPRVKLDPNEHQDYVWASAKEVEMGMVGTRELWFTRQTQVVIAEAYDIITKRKATRSQRAELTEGSKRASRT